ncbi:MAG: MarR family winged helix-turn-helix transcriptional regulator [Acidimicrobiales bacterium]
MAVPASPTTGELAAEAWRALLDYFFDNRDRHAALAAGFGLTVGDMKTLLSLQPDQPRSMSHLAADWKCDASNVTWLVDRLEERGLVERRTSALDRRVKTVALTTAGEATKEQVLARMYEPPDALRSLPREDLEALIRVMARVRAH